jgi:hypothetical protein
MGANALRFVESGSIGGAICEMANDVMHAGKHDL